MTMISTIIATYNRAEVLKDTLDCLLNQKTNNEFDYEIIVVDNNSKDHTREVVRPYTARFPGRLTYLFEPRQGKSYALNRAIKLVKGEIISCVDDDCLLGEAYLWNINRTFQEYGHDVGVLGGRILPKWIGGNCPTWLEQLFSQLTKFEDGTFNWRKIGFEGALGIMDFGNEPFILDYTQKDHPDIQFFGANMAFRKEFLEKYGGFNITKRFSQDTEICERLFNAGVKGVYVPNASLYHKIPVIKVTPMFYYRWWFDRGVYSDFKETINFAFILKIINFFRKSFLEKDLLQKVLLRYQGFYHLGQMKKTCSRSLSSEKPRRDNSQVQNLGKMSHREKYQTGDSHGRFHKPATADIKSDYSFRRHSFLQCGEIYPGDY